MYDSVFIMGPTGVGKTVLLSNLKFNEPFKNFLDMNF